MNPKPVKHLYPDIAKKCNLTEEQFEFIANSYFKKLRQVLSTPNSINIYLDGFGTFSTIERRLLNKYSKAERQLVNAKYKQHIDKLKEDIECYTTLLNQIKEEQEAKKKKRIENLEFKHQQKRNNNVQGES